jgi:heptosyltransferase-1
VDQNLELAEAAGATNLLRMFPLPPGEPEGQLPEGRFVLASPLAGWGSKQWPIEYYEDLAKRIDLPLVINGPPDSKPVLATVRSARVHLSGIPGLIDATRRAHAVIGVDSGPMHLAAALGKPGVAIFGPTDPAANGPYGGSLHVLRDGASKTSYKRRAAIDPSMTSISPAAVARELARVLDSKPASQPA